MKTNLKLKLLTIFVILCTLIVSLILIQNSFTNKAKVSVDWVESNGGHCSFEEHPLSYYLPKFGTNISVLNKIVSIVNLSDSTVDNLDKLKSFKYLKKIFLNNSSIKNISALAYLKNLEEIDLIDTEITELKSISSLSKLKSLFISNTQINNLDYLKNLQNLEVLRISNTNIKSISALYELKNLKAIYAYGVNLKKEEIFRLKKKNPNCEIFREEN